MPILYMYLGYLHFPLTVCMLQGRLSFGGEDCCRFLATKYICMLTQYRHPTYFCPAFRWHSDSLELGNHFANSGVCVNPQLSPAQQYIYNYIHIHIYIYICVCVHTQKYIYIYTYKTHAYIRTRCFQSRPFVVWVAMSCPKQSLCLFFDLFSLSWLSSVTNIATESQAQTDWIIRACHPVISCAYPHLSNGYWSCRALWMNVRIARKPHCGTTQRGDSAWVCFIFHRWKTISYCTYASKQRYPS